MNQLERFILISSVVLALSMVSMLAQALVSLNQ